jgi:tetratricopeptide (TPR) repeat protein
LLIEITTEFMTKQLRRGVLILGLLTTLWLVSCSPRQPATREDVLKWNLAALTNSYDASGHMNPKWDKDVMEAMTEFARTKTASDDELEVLFDLTGDAADNAVNAGCEDPMVRYLYVRYAQENKTRPFKERQELYRSAAGALEQSGYPAIRKFYANVDAAEILWQQRNTNSWPEVRDFRSKAVADLNQAFQDKALPESEAYQAADALFQMLSRNTRELTNAYNSIAATLVGNGSKSAAGQLVKAEFYLIYAWHGRGNGTADRVTPEGWRLFGERLAEAEKALNKAWSADPYDAQIPTLMIAITEGQQKARPEMEKWFQRAMKLDPDNYQACRGKLHYLLPQWYGSRDDMLAFGRECVASTNWGGHVPLILVDAHSEFARTLNADDRKAYWGLPDVWPDIKAGYEKFSQTNPDATRFRYPYAAYAFRCGQWPDFNEQVKIILKSDDEPDYNYFGGREAFDKMVELANRQMGATPQAPPATR